jgi:hypothetical protein
MFRSTLVGKFHQRRLRWTKSLHASGVPDGFPGGFGSLSNAVIHSYFPPFEVVSEPHCCLAASSRLWGKHALDSGVENEFVLLAAKSIPYQIAGSHGATTSALLMSSVSL